MRSWKACQRAACIEPQYDDLSSDAKQGTRQALFIEQTGQCVYCGRGIDLELYNTQHIEHFRPQSRYRHSDVVYANLFLSCGPEQEHGSVQSTCGKAKDNWFDENCHIYPAPEEACQGRFAFASNGSILGDGTPEADEMIGVLKLNHRELIAERSALIEQLDYELNQGLNHGELIEPFLYVSPKGARVSFANVAIQYLRKRHNCVQEL